MQKRIIFLFYILALLLILPVARGDAYGPSYRIFILHSYSMDFRWTEGLHQGITETLKNTYPSSQFRVEFMDTKNFFDEAFLKTLAQTYALKYKKVQFDGIVVTDNNALAFMTSYGKEVFPGVPVVACGINDAKSPEEGSNIKSIIAEESDHGGTIRQALKYWPDAKKLFVLYDATPTGRFIASEVKQSLSSIKASLKAEFISDKNLEELKRFVSTRKATDLAYILPFFRDITGNVFAEGQVARELSSVSAVPILASWSFQLGTGVIGGRVISPNHLGELAMRTLMAILDGHTVSPLQSDISVFENRYDYEVVKQFGIHEKLLPEDATFINRPLSFYEKHRDVLLPAGIVIVILSVITTLLFLNLQKQRTINVTNARLTALDKELITTQRELVSTLGEVIEVRSQETGNHVKRVAKISRLLGEKIGLSNHELEILEAASPMHDVGKIGVPDSILQKAGKLTDSEFDVIKMHTIIGKDILDSSGRELLSIACIIAHQHHERWDGTGYPAGLRGEEISIYARITMLADIYDALSSDRSYKKAWSEKRIHDYIISEREKFFDPYLVDVFFEHIDEVRAIRTRYL
ncbi:HD domain-containing phosphohydrolase [Desulfosediminicola flagellatus]|uniref:HD domain-containing phosphohydrolase n=1 Tax=Desulfosediminicola flagellatus TaxID=2569541 RepID=UPI0010AD5E8D|nr:HD domain-containing phosphohydrolase [Desulfosediminicola flagellatus]